MSDRDFGGLVREARDRLGMSHNRVADLIGRSPSTVRAWERGRSVPTDAGVVSSLAAVLGVDEGSLFDSAGLPRPGTPTRRTLGESLAEIAPPATAVPTPAPVPTPAAPKPEVSESPVGVDVQKPQPGGSAATEPASLQSRRELREQAAANSQTSPRSQSAVSAATGAFDRLVSRFRRRNPRRHALVARPLPTPAPVSQPSYVEDPEQRLLYRFRSLLLAGGIAVLALVFVWSMGELLDAVGSSLDALFGPE